MSGALVGLRKACRWAWGLFSGLRGSLIVALLPNEAPQHVAMTENQTQMAGMEAEVQVLKVRNREAS